MPKLLVGGSHSVPTSVAVPVFGYVASGHCASPGPLPGGVAAPVRTMRPISSGGPTLSEAVGKQERVGSLAQQAWLFPGVA